MIKLKLDKSEYKIQVSDDIANKFPAPIVFYMAHKQDRRRFFITFVIINFSKKSLTYLESFLNDNIEIISTDKNESIFKTILLPHSSLSINTDKTFLVFMQEEKYFYKVDTENLELLVYTADDLIHNVDVFKIGSTFYKDSRDPNYFYFTIVDNEKNYHLYHVSLDLKTIVELDSFPGEQYPPHAIRQYNEHLFLSHEFNVANFELKKNKKIIAAQGLGRLIYKNFIKLKMSKQDIPSDASIKDLPDEEKIEFLSELKAKYDIICLPGKFMMYDMTSKDINLYSTSGGSPAHFEFDEFENAIYVSSHNIFNTAELMILFEPAIIDKYLLKDGKAHYEKSFVYDQGYRYASHRLFQFQNKSYLCTIGHPNRLLFVDTDSMEMLYYFDLYEDVLSAKKGRSVSINSKDEDCYVALEISSDGKYIVTIGEKYIVIFDFAERKVVQKIDFKINKFKDHFAKTVHINYLY